MLASKALLPQVSALFKMSNFDPTTNLALLKRLRDPSDDGAWEEFVRIYRGFWARLLRGRLPVDEQSDVLQDILSELMTALPKFQYDPAKGRFRAWLQVISRRTVLKALRGRGREVLAADIGLDPDHTPGTGPGELDELWDRELMVFVMRRALSEIYGKTLKDTGREITPRVRRILDLIYVKQHTNEVVAAKAKAKPQDVYNARRRWDHSVQESARGVLSRLDGGEWLPQIATEDRFPTKNEGRVSP